MRHCRLTIERKWTKKTRCEAFTKSCGIILWLLILASPTQERKIKSKHHEMISLHYNNNRINLALLCVYRRPLARTAHAFVMMSTRNGKSARGRTDLASTTLKHQHRKKNTKKRKNSAIRQRRTHRELQKAPRKRLDGRRNDEEKKNNTQNEKCVRTSRKSRINSLLPHCQSSAALTKSSTRLPSNKKAIKKFFLFVTPATLNKT